MRCGVKVGSLGLVLALPLVVVGCGGGSSSGGSGRLVVQRDTVGDTVVVRTVSGSVWGSERTLVPEVSIGEESGDSTYLFGQVAALAVGPDGTIYALDQQAMVIRVYGPDGKYRRTLGGSGHGPGELASPDGMVVLPDGRLVVNDIGNQRLQVYAPDGAVSAEWPAPQAQDFMSDPLWWGEHGQLYLKVLRHTAGGLTDWHAEFVRVRADGSLGDTVPLPDTGFHAATVDVKGSSGAMSFPVPFAPDEIWAFDPRGYFVHAISDQYRIDLLRTDAPVLRIERAVAPVRVAAEEKAAAEAPIVRNARDLVPGWHWTGTAVPDRKPFFRAIMLGRHGRIWVLVSTPGRQRPNPYANPLHPNQPKTIWVEPPAFDVFEPGGTYLGRVVPPSGFAVFPPPVFDGDHVWAVTTDSLGVERVVRFRVAGEGKGG